MPSKPEFECKPMEGEPSFLLLARDPQFSVLIDWWVAHREALMRCGALPETDRPKVTNAKVISASGAEWRKANTGKWYPHVTANAVADVPTVQASATAISDKPGAGYHTDTPKGAEIAAHGILAAYSNAPTTTRMVPDAEDLERTYPIEPAVLDAIKRAAVKQDTPLGTLLAFAHIESAFNPEAKAAGGTAAGLYQFTHATWTELVADDGPRLGVKPDMILNPYASSLIMCELLRRDFVQLRRFELAIDAGNAYCLHFLGLTGGVKLIRAATTAAQERSAALFPVAAMSNSNIFNSYPTVIRLYTWLHDNAQSLADAYTRMYGIVNV